MTRFIEKIKGFFSKFKNNHEKVYKPIWKEKWTKRRIKRFIACMVHNVVQFLFGIGSLIFALYARKFDKAGSLFGMIACLFGGMGVGMAGTAFDAFVSPIIFTVPPEA